MDCLRSTVSFLRKKPLLIFILVLELLVLLWVSSLCFHPRTTMTILGTDMQSTENFPVTWGEDGSATTFVELPVDEAPMLEKEISLSPGSYDIQVYYLSVATPEGSTEDEYCYAGWLSLEAQSNPNGILGKRLYLRDRDTDTTERFTIRLGGQSDDLTLKIYQYGYGTLTIQRIQIQESMAYRGARTLGFLGIFAAIDLLYLIFADNPILKLKKSQKYVILGILLITLFGSIVFFADFLLQGHDLRFHLYRIINLSQSLRQGQIPQRIQAEMLNGYGYAAPLFYGELFLLFPALLLLIGVPVQMAYQMYAVAVTLATCIIAYWCFSKMTGDWKKSLFGAALYTLSAYRIINVILRAAVGEYTAMAFFPLILYGFYRIYTAPDREKITLGGYLPITLGLTGILQSHSLSCEIVALFIVAGVLVHIKKTIQLQRFIALAKAALLTLLLNAWYLIPFVQSLLSTKLNLVGANAESNAPYPMQIFAVFPDVLGGSYGRGTQQELPMMIGPALAVALVIWLFWRIHQGGSEKKEPGSGSVSTFFLWGAAALLLSTTLIPWNNLESISPVLCELAMMIQFPMRYLGIAGCFLVFGAVFLAGQMERQGLSHWSSIFICVTLGLSVLTAGSLITKAYTDMEETQIFSPSAVETYHVMSGEYLLEGTDTTALRFRGLITGEGVTAENYTREGLHSQVWCENTSEADSYLDVPITAYPNYHAWLEDGQETTVSIGENNRVRITIPAGYSGMVDLNYQVPVLWRVCEGVSLVTLGGLLVVFLRRRHRNKGMSVLSPVQG